MAKTQAPKIDHFFSAVAARLDLWRDLSRAAQAWTANPASRGDAGLQSACNEALTALVPMEAFQAYPGARLLNAIQERLAGGDALGTARLVQRVSSALMSRSYRSDAGEWESEDDASATERAMPTVQGETRGRPYFEVLFVTPTPPARWPAHAQQIRKLRRSQDAFAYEPVFVGSFEDAVLAVILNTNLESVVIYDGFPYESSRDVPLLKNVLSSRLSLDKKDRASGDNALMLAEVVKRFRPELDIIVLADRKPEAMIADPAAVGIRRIFYEVEEPLEIHLSILSGVAERNETPFFDNLKKYAQKPVGTFHALPVARGKSIFKSNWISDMGEFYGANLFLAESSATSGGLDSLLEPTGNIKKAQDAGRARLRRRPCVLRDQRHLDLQQDGPPGAAETGRHRDRGSQLSQVAPLRDGAGGGPAVLRRGLPHGGVLDVRRRAVADHQEGLARPQGGGPARQGEDGHADQLHLRRSRLRRAPRDGRVSGDQARPRSSCGTRPGSALPPSRRSIDRARRWARART